MTSRFVVCMLLSVLSLSCTDADSLGPTHAPRTGYLRASKVETIDDRLYRLSLKAPGFAGLYYDSTGQLVVRLTQSANRVAAEPLIHEFLARELRNSSKAATDIATMRVLPADFSFAELMQAGQAASTLFADSDVSQIDVDEVRNRVVVGVTNDAVRMRVTEAVMALGSPAPRIQVEVSPPMNVSQSQPTQRFRPVPGGVQITLDAFNLPICTLGWNAYLRDNNGYNGLRYFVTNSHCTQDMGSVRNVRAGQPGTANLIGIEVADPALFTTSANPDCPSNARCRYSDAALFQYFDSAAWNHGKVFVRQSYPYYPYYVYTAYRNILGASDMFRTPSLFVGKKVYKMGRTTNVTSGVIERVCVKTRQFVNGVPTDRVLLCQAQATYTSQGGDSGSPVYLQQSEGVHSPSSPISVLLGLHWGRTPELDMNVVRATFSEWYFVTAELASAISPSGWLEPVYGVCPGCGY